MTAPSPNPPNPHKTASEQESSSNSSRHRPQQQAWGHHHHASSQQGPSRRGPTPISASTTTGLANSSRPNSSSQNRNPWSPNAVAPSAFNRQIGRSSSISSSGSPFSSPPPPPSSAAAVAASSSSSSYNQQQQHQHHQSSLSQSTVSLHSTSKSRNIASAGSSQLASAAATSHGSGGGAGVGGSSSGGSTKSFRASPSLSLSNIGSPAPLNSAASASSSTLLNSGAAASSSSQSGSLSKITIAQIFLLLSTIKEDKDKSKWDSQAEQIRKLVDTNGMEVFTKYFRRLVLTNAPQIWNTGRSTEQNASYQILVSEMQKVGQDQTQAAKIVESIEFGEGEVFKDFDLSAFMDHFRMDPASKLLLASAFKKSFKSDLRTKADAIMSNNLQSFFNAIRQPSATPTESEEVSTDLLAILIDRFAQDPPRNWNQEMHSRFISVLQDRYDGMHIPLEISSAVQMFELLNPTFTLTRHIQRIGSKVTESLDACKMCLESVELRDISYQQVANALLFMVIAKDEPAYDSKIFISALRGHRGGQRLDWQDVVHAFDRFRLVITRQQFKLLFDALLPLAKEYENFDIQLLWGGDWRHADTQLNFASAFVSFSEDELDVNSIPRLRRAFTMDDFQDASDDIKAYAENAARHPLVSLDATRTLFSVIFRSSETYAQAQGLGVVESIINPKMDLFVSSVSAIPKPWGALQDQAIKQLFSTIFLNEITGQAFTLHLLWKRDMNWVASRLLFLYQQDPMTLTRILAVSHQHGWLNELIGVNNELSLDLAAVAHGKDLFNIDTWLDQIAQAMRRDRLVSALSQFLRNKAEDDTQVHREGTEPVVVPLTVKTVYALLNFLGNENISEEDRTSLQRVCMTAYPRLINYGEGFDAIIDANGRNGNFLPSETDAKMQEHYKMMYSGESSVKNIVETLRNYKHSEDPAEQDLFACMIFGLFDEYNCFAEYPMDALATTAVLFGSIINYKLLSRIALQVAIAMVLDAVRDHHHEAPMYLFGLQALVEFPDRLEEWSRLSDILLEIPSLRNTQIYPVIERIARTRQESSNGDENVRGGAASTAAADDFLAPEPRIAEFTCLSVDPPARPDFFRDPDEKVQEVVLFVLNNVSERNLDAKTLDLRSKLLEEHYQWFANYLVESRIKPQPNFHELYMNLLNNFNDTTLWSEVLRETYVCTIRMLNAEATMNSSTERTNLKNLGSWLGSMTVARNQAIRYRNISFKDLLVEAHDSQRLAVAIPFTCKVLTMAAKSMVFRPPCSWTMEIVGILIELYQFAELKLNMKFEIEVLCKALSLDQKDLEPSDTMRSRPVQTDDSGAGVIGGSGSGAVQSSIVEGVDNFNDIPLMNFRGPRGTTERFSPSAMALDLSDLSSMLKHNYSLPPSSPAIQNGIRHLLSVAVERAVAEIIGPVVERSVTIAAISTSQLISKDYALEPDENRYRESAHTAVRALAGSLAGVTCKEPLRSSIANNIGILRHEVPEQSLPQGSVLMFVNDNLDTVCNIVEKAAENASINEIDAQMEEAIESRKNGTFREPNLSRWSFYIPEPFRPAQGGLSQEQISIYEDFGRTSRNIPSQSALSPDNARQLPDVLQDQFGALPNLSTDLSSMPRPLHSTSLNQHSNGIQQNSHQLMNGFTDSQTLAEQVVDYIAGLHQSATDAADEFPSRPLLESTTVQEWWQRLKDIIMTAGILQKDQATMGAASELIKLILGDQQRSLVTEFLARVLRSMCSISDITSFHIQKWCFELDEDQFFSTNLTVALVKSNLLDIRRVDLLVSKALQQRKQVALTLLDSLVDRMLLGEVSGALRADLATSLSALTTWSFAEPNSSAINQLLQKLRVSSILTSVTAPEVLNVKDAQANYIFEEWTRLQQNGSTTPSLISFILQLHSQDILGSREQSAAFFRACIESAIVGYQQEEARLNASIEDCFLRVDSLAKMIVMLVTHQGDVNGSVKGDKAAFFERILSLLVLILAQHYKKQGERLDSKIFFRLFSTIMYELHESFVGHVEVFNSLMHVMAGSLLTLQPQVFTGFAFGWMSLVSHRLFMPSLLKSHNDQGWELYCSLLEKHLSFTGELLKPYEVSDAGKEFCRGTLRLLLVLHHDFPEFLGEYHFRLLSQIPHTCTQLRSLIVSATPLNAADSPDPFTDGLKVDRSGDMRRSPVIRADLISVLRNAGILAAVDEFLGGGGQETVLADRISLAVFNPAIPQTTVGYVPITCDAILLNALVLHIGKHAESVDRARPLPFSPTSTHGRLFDLLTDRLQGEARYHLIGAIINQLRYPNNHTHYFSHVLLHIYRPGQADRLALDIQQQITRILLERIIVHRPHPWGLIAALLEVLKNRMYRFWDLPFVKASPEIERMFASLLQQMGQGAANRS